jgi:hypothetical protein
VESNPDIYHKLTSIIKLMIFKTYLGILQCIDPKETSTLLFLETCLSLS